MLELTLCSMLTILPDFLFRRFVQGKRFGHEINLFSVWYELRWGITACLILTISLITMVFYFHPSTTNAVSLFRTVPILAEGIGRVAEVYVTMGQEVKAGTRCSSWTAPSRRPPPKPPASRSRRSRPPFAVKQTELASADGKIQEARARSSRRSTNSKQSGIVQAQFRHCQQARHRTAAKRGRWPARFARRCDCLQAKHRGQPQHAVAGAKGERRSKPCTGAGGTRQDDRLCRASTARSSNSHCVSATSSIR